jgi:hypothetical protein
MRALPNISAGALGREEPNLTGFLSRSESRPSELIGKQDPITDINFIVSDFVTKHVRIFTISFEKA